MIKLYENIRARREELHMTQEELARKMGYKSRSTIAKIESGESDIPQKKIAAFAKALETTPGLLMGVSDDYYMSQNTAEMAQKLFDSPGRRALFDTTKNATEDDLKAINQIIELYMGKKDE